MHSHILPAAVLFVIITILSVTTILSVVAVSAETVRFVQIGDYGRAVLPSPNHHPEYTHTGEATVAAQVKAWNPDFIITTGDNNYPHGEQKTIDANIGQFYRDYIYPYVGNLTRSASAPSYNRFFPSLGNHGDKSISTRIINGTSFNMPWPYVDYFAKSIPRGPGKFGLYYDFIKGPIHFFALDSNWQEPDGIDVNGKQAQWLKKKLSESTAPHRIVYWHHLLFTNNVNDPASPKLRWPFKKWGASLVLSGHEHAYEKITWATEDGNFPLIANGLSGTIPLYDPKMKRYNASPVAGTQSYYYATWGWMNVVADENKMNFTFQSVDKTYYDYFTIDAVYPPKNPTTSSTAAATTTTTSVPPLVTTTSATTTSAPSSCNCSNNNNNNNYNPSTHQKHADSSSGKNIGIGILIGIIISIVVGGGIMWFTKHQAEKNSSSGGANLRQSNSSAFYVRATEVTESEREEPLAAGSGDSEHQLNEM